MSERQRDMVFGFNFNPRPSNLLDFWSATLYSDRVMLYLVQHALWSAVTNNEAIAILIAVPHF